MRLLIRTGLFCLVIGLVIGLFLRARVKKLYLMITLGFLPWVIHLAYIVISVWDIPLMHLGLFLVGNVLVLLSILGLAWTPIKRRSLWIALLPTLQGFIYSLSLLWFIRILSIDGLGLNSLSWVVYASAALAMSGMLLGYMFHIPLPKLGSLIKRSK
jgi:hypothetical protein